MTSKSGIYRWRTISYAMTWFGLALALLACSRPLLGKRVDAPMTTRDDAKAATLESALSPPHEPLSLLFAGHWAKLRKLPIRNFRQWMRGLKI